MAKDAGRGEAPRPGWPRWKKACVLLGAAVLLSGLGLHAWTALRPVGEGVPVAQRARQLTPPEAQGFAASGSRTGAAGGHAAAEPAQPLAARAAPILTESGIMFFAGLCIGAAVRAVAKLLAVLIGLGLLGVLGLQHAGVLPPVDWHAVGQHIQSLGALLQAGAGRLDALLTHTLPSGTLAGLGLATGLKRS
ncbi:MAG: hypothetical protein KatS3mg102_1306 [Planctomycetota bacterium]|nr:MAG: hypothetical protein KatS3mg102_1306 [Planctomycetota bacterium]